MAIYHKGKELLDTVHEGKSILNIYHMGKVYLKEWLSSDTKAAIRLAFGEEVVQVIKSTNAYLDTIASTDAQKAETLANYINEDPMLIVSLVEVGKVRGLHTSNGAKIFTNYIPLTTDLVRVTLKINADTTSVSYGTRNTAGVTDGGAFYVYTNNTKRLRIDWATSNTTTFVDMELNKYFTVEHKKGYCTIDGKVVFNNPSVSAVNAKHPLYLFSMNNAGNPNTSLPNETISEVYCEGKIHLIPMLHPTEGAGMLDLISLQFYPNSNTEGVFTIELTDK